MRIPVAIRVLGAASLAVFTACGELPTAPSGAPLDVAAPSLAKGGKAKSSDQDTKTVTVLVNPGRSATYRLNSHWVRIPANVICGDGSGYDSSLWDAPCASLATEPFLLTVEVTEIEGRSMARFKPDLRFAPAKSKKDWVVLGLKVHGNLDEQLGYGILYQPTGSDVWIDESVEDPTLKAWRAKGSVVARRLKHFSGYNVSLGFSEQTDPMDGFGGLQ